MIHVKFITSGSPSTRSFQTEREQAVPRLDEPSAKMVDLLETVMSKP
jgi:hypothetical protein